MYIYVIVLLPTHEVQDLDIDSSVLIMRDHMSVYVWDMHMRGIGMGVAHPRSTRGYYSLIDIHLTYTASFVFFSCAFLGYILK